MAALHVPGGQGEVPAAGGQGGGEHEGAAGPATLGGRAALQRARGRASRVARPFPMAGTPGVGVAYSDASGEYGFGAWTLHEGRVLYLSGEWSPTERAGMHINLKELFAMAASLGTFLPITKVRYVAEFTDNTAAEGAARRLSPRTAPMQRLVERRVELLRSKGAFSAVARVATGENKWADLLSRAGGEADFLQQVAALGLDAVRCSVPAEWRDTAELVGGVSL